MGKKLVIKGADFSANGVFFSALNYEDYAFINGTLASADHSWVNTLSSGNINKSILVPIPSQATKIIVDASEIIQTYKGKTVSGTPLTDNPIINFLTGTPEDTSDGTVESKWIERHSPSKGNTVEIDIPATATVMMVHMGYWKNNLSVFYSSRIPKSIVFKK